MYANEDKPRPGEYETVPGSWWANKMSSETGAPGEIEVSTGRVQAGWAKGRAVASTVKRSSSRPMALRPFGPPRRSVDSAAADCWLACHRHVVNASKQVINPGKERNSGSERGEGKVRVEMSSSQFLRYSWTL
ncbi:hypothetical protein KM043_014870 [Ampulex compressa]|nr:hypothetical protein KM043_014870 [Ampulex compressa]